MKSGGVSAFLGVIVILVLTWYFARTKNFWHQELVSYDTIEVDDEVDALA
jgi:hypothetical protein